MRIIGITGGIATGKSTVAHALAQHNFLVLDADELAREAVLPGSTGLQAIHERYGPQILQADGSLNRGQLAQIIFRDGTEKAWIERLIHPYVRGRLESERDRWKDALPTLVMVIPLLFEADMTDLVTEIWVVSCSPEQQLTRLMQRNHLSQAEAQARIDSQMPLHQKCDQANVVLDNSGNLDDLKAQIDQALQSQGQESLN